MNQYYLIAQLPTLDGLGDNMPLPITEDRFLELCSRFVSKKTMSELQRLSLTPPRRKVKFSSSVAKAWDEHERSLRLILGKARAERMKKSFDADDAEETGELLALARTAVKQTDPLEAEKLLNRSRLEFLEGLRPADAFSEEMLFYYSLKLKLISRIRQFDESAGESAYKNIYSSIVRGDILEVTQ